MTTLNPYFTITSVYPLTIAPVAGLFERLEAVGNKWTMGTIFREIILAVDGDVMVSCISPDKNPLGKFDELTVWTAFRQVRFFSSSTIDDIVRDATYAIDEALAD